MLALVVGTLLSLSALAFVLYPLFTEAVPRRAASVNAPAADDGDGEAIAALREIEFDRETGKLAQSDYDELRERYTKRALAAMRRQSDIAGSADDVLESAIAAYRSRLKECVACGPRPEPDAVYCSNCGTYLPGQCASCGVSVSEKGATYCTSCGRSLAA